MKRQTIDYGIDLGTTNSCIAVLNGTDVEVIDNNEGHKTTPSAVLIKKDGSLYVGTRAKNYLGNDDEDAFHEFKLNMGKEYKYKLSKNAKSMTPEELSAEVLKELKDSVYQRKGEIINAAAISVPAAFGTPQNMATDKAARLAGLNVSPLLQEPIAAALAYGFQDYSKKRFWLVYDLGGGTFDVAIMHVDDGEIKVVNHGGDNNLGGKKFDEEVVTKLFVPKLMEEYPLKNVSKDENKWKVCSAKLKMHAEEAKIELSRYNDYQIYIDYLGEDDEGKRMSFDYKLTRSELEKLMEPYLERTFNICNKVLTDKKLGSDDIEKIILVGGPTLTPLLREQLKGRLNIPLEHSIDPLTVVARGAAIFAGTQILRESNINTVAVNLNKYSVQLDYKPIDSDTEPLVGGVVKAPENKALGDISIEFTDTKTKWSSGKIMLTDKGSFMSTLKAEKNRSNEYSIMLRDKTGDPLEVEPDHFTIKVGASIASPPLTHSIGVAEANNRMDLFVKKGTPLPCRHLARHRTVIELKKGNLDSKLRIPVVEGEHLTKADRNRLIGYIEVNSEAISRDVPPGSEVQISLEINESRLIFANVFIPMLEESIVKVLELQYEPVDRDKIKEHLEKEKSRLAELKQKAEETGDNSAKIILERIDKEQMLEGIEAAFTKTLDSDDSLDECAGRLIDLANALDEVEDALEWPALVEQANKTITLSKNLLNDIGSAVQKSEFKTLEAETQRAITAKDIVGLRESVEAINLFALKIVAAHPLFWSTFYEDLKGKRSQMKDQNRASQLFYDGNQAVKNENIEKLKQIIIQLMELLPESERPSLPGHGGGTIGF